MSTKTLKLVDEKKAAKNMMLSQRCLGIVLRRVGREGEAARNGEGPGSEQPEDWVFESGYLIFQEFQEENRQCFWNQPLVDSVNSVEYMGYVAPGTLLTCGNEFYLETLRSAWARRVLKAPANFVIKRLGDVTGLEMQVIPQTQFTPLPEALCLVISELNRENETASLEIIFTHLQERFCDMLVPNQEIVYQSLGKLIKDRKVYHTGDGYFIVTPVTYHMTTMSTLPERPLLMSNEEAIHKLHGELLSPSKTTQATRTRSIQTNIDDVVLCTAAKSPSSEYSLAPTKLERSGSLRLSRKEKHKSQDDGSFARSESMKLSPQKSKSLIKDINLKSSPAHQNVEKGEKVSVFSKLFRRSSSRRRKGSKSPAKYATFSAQFPPAEWSDPAIINYHSRSTQTLQDGRSSSRDPRPVSAAFAPVTITVASSPPSTNTVSSQTSIKSKTDSLTRLREHDKSNHRSRSSTLDSAQDPGLERCSALPRKIPSHSCVIGEGVPALSPVKTSASPKRVSASRASLSQSSSPCKTGKSHSRSGTDLSPNVANGSPLRDPCKVSNTEHFSENLHASATALNKMDVEAKVKNTELRNDEEYKLSEVNGTGFSSDLSKRKPGRSHNRWSVHGSEGTMNNVVTSPRKPSPRLQSPKHPGIKCINKLHSGSAGSSPVHKGPSNMTAAVRPTQAIRPMNQAQPEQPERNGGCFPEKVPNTGAADPSLTPSPSFNKSFDLESADFKSITAHKLLKGISINSIDTLVEVNLAAESQPQANTYANNFQVTAANGNQRQKTTGPSLRPLKQEEPGTMLNNAPLPKRYGDALRSRFLAGKTEVAKNPVEGTECKKLQGPNSPTEGTKVTALV